MPNNRHSYVVCLVVDVVVVDVIQSTAARQSLVSGEQDLPSKMANYVLYNEYGLCG